MPANALADVVVELAGAELRGWESVAVQRSLDSIAAKFAVTASELEPEDPRARSLRLGQACAVRLGEDLVLSGFVDALDTYYDDQAHTLAVAGRDLTGDLVDCSADRSPGEWAGQTLDKIVRDIVAPFGVELLAGADPGTPFERFRLALGERAADAIHRGAAMRGLLPTSNGTGGLRLIEPGSELAPAAIDRSAEGAGRIVRGRLRSSTRGRYSRYSVKGQTDMPEAWSTDAGGAAEGLATDPGIDRYRPLVLIETTRADRGALRRRAEFEATTRAARSRPVLYRVQGWRAAGGWLWAPGYRVPVYDPILGVGTAAGAARELLLVSVTYTTDERAGRVVDLVLLDPVAFQVLRLTEQPVSEVELWTVDE